MRIPAKVVDYSSGKPKGHTVCLAIDKKNATAIPHDEHLPPRRSIPITLDVNGVTYNAKVFARPKVPYVWISTSLKRNNRPEKLSTVLLVNGIGVGDQVHLDVVGNRATLI